MNKHWLSRVLSMTAAAAIGCTGIIGSGLSLTAGAEETEDEVSLTSVIVKVTGQAVLTTPEGDVQGADFLSTDEAMQMASALEGTQSYVQREIRASIYPELEVKYSYSILYNGFSCDIPEDQIDAVKALPFVEDVMPVKKSAVPRLSRAAGLGGAPAYYDATGCTGEGQVIAIIDTELDVTHPMFAALDENVDVKLTQEDIAEIADGIGFNVDIDPAKAYLSSKLPFVIDYVDDPYEGLPDESILHGTHVAGIAAGNEYTDADGTVLSGIAKNAQIVFMAASDSASGGYLVEDAYMAAMEDAVKLHADVINMSFGSNGELYEYGEALGDMYTAAEKAGVTICVAAGNEDNGSMIFGETHSTLQPDTSEITSMVTDHAPILTVASADNLHTVSYAGFEAAGTRIPYLEIYRLENETEPDYLKDHLQGEYEYVYCGTGTEEDYEGLDLTGKIALVDNDYELWIDDKAAPAIEAGAVGLILIDFEGQMFLPVLAEGALPMGIVNYEDGQNMKNAKDKTLRFIDETVDVDMPTAVSEYTSWGIKQDLELRPDIMGVGGYVESAVYGGTDELSGTSMASPYLAGCAAVLNEYLTRQGLSLDGAEKLRYMRNLLMTSAVPYEEDGLYVTPRRQGAGLVSLNNVIADKVLLTGQEGESKIMLGGSLGDSFGFDLNLRNLSDEDVAFTSARLVLTTDSSFFDDAFGMDIIAGQQALTSSANLDGLLTVRAGESRTEHIDVTLDAAQTSQIADVFANGFFVEGYLLLSGAENCCDISVPLVGFHGDWAQLPIFNDYECFKIARFGGSSVILKDSYAKLIQLMLDIQAQIPEEALTDPDADLLSLMDQYATEEQLDALYAPAEFFYASPNGDGLADMIGCNFYTQRYCHFEGLTLYDADNKIMLEGEVAPLTLRGAHVTLETLDEWDEVPEGAYTAQISCCINDPESEAHPQVLSFPVTIDRTAPEITASVREEDGRRILTLTAKDDTLDGIYISGTGNGGIYGEYDPETATPGGMQVLTTAELFRQLFTMEDTFYDREYNAEDASLIAKMLASEADEPDYADVDFTDLIIAKPDKNGSFTVEYDITDLSAYRFEVMDKALNTGVYASEATPADSIVTGTYSGQDRFYYFDGDTCIQSLYQDGSEAETSFTLKNGEAQLGDTSATIEKINSHVYRLIHEDGSAETLTFRSGEPIYGFYTNDQIEARVLSQTVGMYGEPENMRTEVSVNSKGIVTVSVYGTDEDGEEALFESIQVNHISGEAKSLLLGELSLYPISFTDAVYGVQALVTGDKVLYLDFGRGQTISQEDGAAGTFSYEQHNTRVTLTIDGKERTADYSIEPDGCVLLAWENSDEVSLLRPANADPETLRIYSNQELCEMALDYYEAKNGTRPESASAAITDALEISITLGDEVYTVSPFDATGINAAGEAIDLKEILPVMDDPFRSGIYFACGITERYYWFDGQGGGTVRLTDGTDTDFTYEMTQTGMLFTNSADGEQTPVPVFVREDGTVVLDWSRIDQEFLTYRSDKALEDFTFYTREQLENMAVLHAGVPVGNVTSYYNQDGTVQISLFDENGELLASYTVDPETAEGSDEYGELHDLKTVTEPDYPKDAYAREDLEQWAVNDLRQKTGTKAADVTSCYGTDGKLTITMTDKDGEILDYYTVDPATGEGENKDGEAVSLPQTGNNAPETAAAASGSVLLTLAGLILMLRSRKKEQH